MFTPPPSPEPPRSYRATSSSQPSRGRQWDAHLAPSRSPSLSSSSSRSSSPTPTLTSGSATLPLGSASPSPPCRPSLQEQYMLSLTRKQKTARRTRWTILLVPLALVIITLSTRYLSHPALLDVLSPEYSSGIWDELLDWRPHDDIHAPHLRRAPEPVPQGFSVEPTSTVISFPGQSTQSGSSTFVSSPASASASASSTPSTISASSTIPTIPATPPVLPTPFPQPFSSLGSSNFATESCYIFFQNMSDTDPFRTCRPFSLLVQSSADFINQAQSNITLLNTLVWGTCNTDPSVDQCVANMGWFAQQLQSACTTEISQTNELVTSTLIGLEAYSLMRSAGCLPDTATNAYCYVESVESSHPDDMFYYQLPLGTALPNNTLPSCSSCTQSLMAQYVEEGLNTTGLRETYADAALITNKVCGNGFVSETVTEKTGGALRARTGTWAAVAAVVLAIAHVSC